MTTTDRATVAKLTGIIADLDRKIAAMVAEAAALVSRAEAAHHAEQVWDYDYEEEHGREAGRALRDIINASRADDFEVASCLDEEVDELRHERHFVVMEMEMVTDRIEQDRQFARDTRY